jgi:CubicO group peptidase (beta-lactamase class C family)
VSSALERITGRTLAKFARSNLFEPLGIADWYWEPNADGTSLGGVGLFLKPRDLARIAQLVLQRGWWNGRPVASEAWLALSTSARSTSDDARSGDPVRT